MFIAAEHDLFPLLRALFNRPEFYATGGEAGTRAQPAEYAVTLMAGDEDPAATSASCGAARRWVRSCSTRRTSPVEGNSYWLNTSALSGRANLAKTSRTRCARTAGSTPSTTMATADAVDHVATYFGVTLSPVTRDALDRRPPGGEEHHQGQRVVGADEPADHGHGPPEFHMA